VSKPVGDTGDERRLGPDHGELDLERLCQLEQPVRVLGPDGVARAERGDPGVARRGMQLDVSACELPGKRVPASPGATISVRTRRV
jgi:hypothetical protein